MDIRWMLVREEARSKPKRQGCFYNLKKYHFGINNTKYNIVAVLIKAKYEEISGKEQLTTPTFDSWQVTGSYNEFVLLSIMPWLHRNLCTTRRVNIDS